MVRMPPRFLARPTGGRSDRDKNVIVVCSERINLDQNGSERIPDKPLKNQL
jgi:hypothetical protein